MSVGMEWWERDVDADNDDNVEDNYELLWQEEEEMLENGNAMGCAEEMHERTVIQLLLGILLLMKQMNEGVGQLFTAIKLTRSNSRHTITTMWSRGNSDLMGILESGRGRGIALESGLADFNANSANQLL